MILSEAQEALVKKYPPASAEAMAFWWGALESGECIPWTDQTVGALLSRIMVQAEEGEGD